jgi:hypothetical protein
MDRCGGHFANDGITIALVVKTAGWVNAEAVAEERRTRAQNNSGLDNSICFS